MLKYALLGAAMAMTAPALAQTAANPTPAAPEATQAAPATATPQTAPAPAPAAADPAQPTPAPETAAQPAPADAPQVASVVDTEFGTYDKDASGTLSEAEFGTWMVALKSQTDPKTDPNSAATKTWNKAAFAQADKDKSKSVSKTELTGFLAPAKS